MAEEPAKPLYICPYCRNGFMERAVADKHIKKKHHRSVMNYDPRPRHLRLADSAGSKNRRSEY